MRCFRASLLVLIAIFSTCHAAETPLQSGDCCCGMPGCKDDGFPMCGMCPTKKAHHVAATEVCPTGTSLRIVQARTCANIYFYNMSLEPTTSHTDGLSLTLARKSEMIVRPRSFVRPMFDPCAD